MPSLYKYQSDAVEALSDKHILLAGCGLGKTAISVVWAERRLAATGKSKLLVVTTASKARTHDWQDEIDMFAPRVNTLAREIIVISWHRLAKWVAATKNFSEWVVIFDELQRSKHGVGSGMGRSFLRVTAGNKDWMGATGTPGDSFIEFYPYYVAGGYVKNKTSFVRDFCQTQTYKGYMEIVGYNRTDLLRKWWRELSYSPDTSQVEKDIPAETHKTVAFKTPANYKKVIRTRATLDGELLDTASALTHYLRQMCFTKEKEEWLGDFFEDLGEGAVLFFNYTGTADRVEEIAKRRLPKGARVWRIDGSHHDIPTADTIGEKDIVLCQWQSGSEALNLQFLRVWVSIEPHYAYSTSVQARGRIRRLGQTRKMMFFYLKCENSIEEDVYEILKTKGDFAAKEWCEKNNLIEEK